MVDGFVFGEHEGSVEARGVAVEPGGAEPGGLVARAGGGVADGVAGGAAVAREGDEARDVRGDLGEGAREGRLVRGGPRRDRTGHVVVGGVRGGLATLREAVHPDRELRQDVGGSLGVVSHGHVEAAELAKGAEQIGEREAARRARRVHLGGGDRRHHRRVPRLDAAAVLRQTLPPGRHRRHRRARVPSAAGFDGRVQRARGRVRRASSIFSRVGRFPRGGRARKLRPLATRPPLPWARRRLGPPTRVVARAPTRAAARARSASTSRASPPSARRKVPALSGARPSRTLPRRRRRRPLRSSLLPRRLARRPGTPPRVRSSPPPRPRRPSPPLPSSANMPPPQSSSSSPPTSPARNDRLSRASSWWTTPYGPAPNPRPSARYPTPSANTPGTGPRGISARAPRRRPPSRSSARTGPTRSSGTYASHRTDPRSLPRRRTPRSGPSISPRVNAPRGGSTKAGACTSPWTPPNTARKRSRRRRRRTSSRRRMKGRNRISRSNRRRTRPRRRGCRRERRRCTAPRRHLRRHLRRLRTTPTPWR